MKTRCVLFSLLVISSFAFAGWYIPWDDTKPPTLSLAAAYERAVTALGIATNKLHCISARVSTRNVSTGGWDFTFYSTNKPPKTKYVTVGFDGKAYVSDLPSFFR